MKVSGIMGPQKNTIILETKGMIDMDKYEYIRIAKRVYGKSIHQIKKETGHDRKTIRKVLRGEPCTYSQREQQPYPVLGPYLEIIDEWLKEDKAQGKKQRHTARRIYNRLKKERGYGGSESGVRHYVREAKIRLGLNTGKVFIPCDPECGKEAEIDWGGAAAIIDGVKMPIKLFCMRSRYSGKHFVRAYPCERQQAFFDGHIHAFEFFGGIYPVLVYDNLSSAVKQILRGKNRREQESFIKFRAYYNFSPRFCNPASGHEKGGVEGMVGYVRRNYLVPIPRVESMEELNEQLLAHCFSNADHRIEGKEGTVEELFEKEKPHLVSLPCTPFSNITIDDGKVRHYSTVLVDKNHYSVPTSYSGLKIKVHISIDEVEIFWDGKKIATHKRVFGNNKWQLEPHHYLKLIQQRPGSFETARPIRQWRACWPKALESLLGRFQASQGETGGIKDFINVLMLYENYPAKEIDAAVELALENQISSSEAVVHILLHTKIDPSCESLSDWPATVPSDVSVYGQLGGVQ
jgi:transposase